MRGLKMIVAAMTVYASVSCIAQMSGSAGKIAKFTSGSQVGDSVITESNGKIGIGTDSPNNTLHVISTQGQMAQFQNNNGEPARVVLNGSTNDAGFAGDLIYQYNGLPVFGIYTTDGTNAALGFYPGDAATAALAIQQNGNVGIGTTPPAAKLDVNGSMKLSGGGASLSFPDNSIQSTAWNGTTCGGDYAESVDVAGDRKVYTPGDLLVINEAAPDHFARSSEPYSTLIAGVFSTKPGLTGRRQGAPALTGDEVPMAMMGIVPGKVSAENGPIKPGDLLVSSATPGFAMKGTDRSRMLGAVVGKAMGRLDKGTGVIEVLVTLQ